jgi:HAD superfamily hydrolase (TIGR01509 family)
VAPSFSSVKAVVFDKDGVLADSEAINIRSAFEVFRAHGHELVPDDEAAIVGKHPIHYVPAFARRFRMSGAEERQVFAEQDVLYNELWQGQGRMLDGAREALAGVRRRGLGVGLATSSNRREVDSFIDRFELAAFFDVTLSLDDVTRAKPDPEVYLSSARQLDVPLPEMLVVEDSEYGIRAAKDAGAICVAVRTPHVRPECIAAADVRIDSIGELLELLDP